MGANSPREKTTTKILTDGRLRKDNDIGERGIRHCATEVVRSRVYVDFFRDEGVLSSVYVRRYSAAKRKGDYVGGEVILV